MSGEVIATITPRQPDGWEEGVSAVLVAIRAFEAQGLPTMWLTEAPAGLLGLATDRVELKFRGPFLPELVVRRTYEAHYARLFDEAERQYGATYKGGGGDG